MVEDTFCSIKIMEFSNSSSDEIVNTSGEDGKGIGDEVGDSHVGLLSSENFLNLNGSCLVFRGTSAVVSFPAYDKVVSPSEGSLSETSSGNISHVVSESDLSGLASGVDGTKNFGFLGPKK